MVQVNLQSAFKVTITEYERGWGSKVDEVLYFDNETEAKAYAEDYNVKYNTEKVAPDWYMSASYDGKVR